MDSLFPKMLAEIETNVDIVFVIDVTKSMERMIDIIQTAAISFLDEFFEKMNSMKRRVENLRVKVISFRDFYYDGNHAYNESKFFTMPNEKMDLMQKQRERDTSQLYIQKTCQKISMNYIMCGKAIQKTSVKR